MPCPFSVARLRHIRLAAAAIAAVTAAVLPAAAQAAPTTESIHMTWLRSGTTSSAPFRGTGAGAFTASGALDDSGTVSVTGQDTSVPSPVVAVAWLDEVLTSPGGMLELRCPAITKGPFTDPSHIPVRGSCTIISGTGIYAGQHGHGDFTGFVNLTVAPAGQVTQDITLKLT
jgi:hypothetical protein